MARTWVVRAALVAAVLLVPGGAAAGGAQPGWWSYDRPAAYTTVRTNVLVPMRDGTPIHCAVSQPARDGAALAGPFPSLITVFTPYGALNAPGALPGDDFWADHGYVAVACDVRGTGESGGTWQGPLSAVENVDNYDVIQWMAAQPWSNGRIGQLGVSYGGMTAMRVASLHPPHLLAISPLSSEDDLYLEDVYPGGIKSTPGTGDVWPGLTIALSGGRELAAYTFALYLQHPLWDDFWKQVAVSTKWRDITLPVLALGGWNDTLVPGGAPGNYIGLRQAGNKQNYLIMGPWGHAATGDPAPLPAGVQLAWFDRWVMGLKQAPLPNTAVASYEQPAGGAGRGWVQLSSWPPSGTDTQTWALNVNGTVARKAGPAGTRAYTTLPTDAGDNGVTDNGAVPPGERADQTLTFDTAPLATDLVIAGRVVVNLRAAIDSTDANFKAVMYDVAPEGTVTFLNEGYMKGSHRLSQEAETPVIVGQKTDFHLQIFPMHWRFAAGHVLRFRIYGGHSTELVPQPLPVTTTLALGTGGSTVSLPVYR
jgi:predicted acyl esterase